LRRESSEIASALGNLKKKRPGIALQGERSGGQATNLIGRARLGAASFFLRKQSERLFVFLNG